MKKGKNAEREFASWVFDELGVKMARNLDQPRSGGHDLSVVDPGEGEVSRALDGYAIECKRKKRVLPCDMAAWWLQACDQAADAGKTPCLAYRADRMAWRVVIPLHAVNKDLTQYRTLAYTAEMSVEGFCAVVRG